jgi:hypothetical protein
MNIQVTGHAQTRFQQRGINQIVVDYLVQYGEAKHAPGGALKISLSKRNCAKMIGALKKEMKQIERAGEIIIVEKDGLILTGYHKN